MTLIAHIAQQFLFPDADKSFTDLALSQHSSMQLSQQALGDMLTCSPAVETARTPVSTRQLSTNYSSSHLMM